MFRVKNLLSNDDIKTVQEEGPFRVIEYLRDLSIRPEQAALAYYCGKMGLRKRQVICDLSKGQITLSPGAMQWMVGDVQATTGIKGAGDLIGKAFRGKVTGESAIKPEYKGNGMVMTEVTYRFPIIINVAEWGGAVTLEDGLFLACDSALQHKAVMRSNISSAVAGGEGLFNLELRGDGYAVLESDCPMEELVEIELQDDVLKIDGNYAIAWSGSLNFTVERSGKTLIGSAAAGEGLANVYRGTGKVLMMPV